MILKFLEEPSIYIPYYSAENRVSLLPTILQIDVLWNLNLGGQYTRETSFTVCR